MDGHKYRQEQGVPPWMEVERMEFLLRTEVAFWRDLVNNCGAEAPPESVERMRHALALAEHRLLQLYGDLPQNPGSTEGPAGTSRPPSDTLS